MSKSREGVIVRDIATLSFAPRACTYVFAHETYARERRGDKCSYISSDRKVGITIRSERGVRPVIVRVEKCEVGRASSKEIRRDRLFVVSLCRKGTSDSTSEPVSLFSLSRNIQSRPRECALPYLGKGRKLEQRGIARARATMTDRLLVNSSDGVRRLSLSLLLHDRRGDTVRAYFQPVTSSRGRKIPSSALFGYCAIAFVSVVLFVLFKRTHQFKKTLKRLVRTFHTLQRVRTFVEPVQPA